MASRGHLTPTGLLFQQKTFIAKTEAAIIRTPGKLTALGLLMQNKTFSAKSVDIGVKGNAIWLRRRRRQ